VRMTPLEIQSHRFGRRLRGYDQEEVQAFLRMVTDDYEALLTENESQRQRIHHLEESMQRLTAQETLLQETLLNAQSLSDRMREAASKECDVLIGEAEVRAEKILDASHRRAARLAENIREMRSVRGSLAESLRSAIDNHLGMIDRLANDPHSDLQIEASEVVEGLVDGKITYLAASARHRVIESIARTEPHQTTSSTRVKGVDTDSESSGGG
jgi:cell division initiation protein